MYDYGARFYSPLLGRFISADTIVPSLANPQSLNRYAYVLNSPLRFTDPTGHACDDGPATWQGCLDLARSRSARTPLQRYVRVGNIQRGGARFDLNHVTGFPNLGGGQAGFWRDFRLSALDAISSGQDFDVRLQSGLTNVPGLGLLTLSRTYRVSANIREDQFFGVAMAIYQDYSRAYEAAQGIRSNFANEDLPSNYLGLVGQMMGLSGTEALFLLAELEGQSVTSTSDETIPPLRMLPLGQLGQILFPDMNFEFTRRVQVNGAWQNVPWPHALQVAPIMDSRLWRLTADRVGF